MTFFLISSWLPPLSSLQSFLARGFFPRAWKKHWGVFCLPIAAFALWFPRDAHADPTVLQLEFLELLRGVKGIPLLSYSFWGCFQVWCCSTAQHRAVLPSSCPYRGSTSALTHLPACLASQLQTNSETKAELELVKRWQANAGSESHKIRSIKGELSC